MISEQSARGLVCHASGWRAPGHLLMRAVAPAQGRQDGPDGSSVGTRSCFISHFLFRLAVGGLLLLSFAGLPSGSALAVDAESSDYRLGAQDKLRIRVFEWRPAKDEIFEWAAFGTEFTIGATGKLSLPLIGEVPAAGLSIRELAKAVGGRFRQRMGLVADPDVSVEVVQFRPFYVVGHVQKPGEYPYRPGLSLLQAISISGGLQRANDQSVRLEREILATRGELNLLAREFSTLLARKARLQGELKGTTTIDFPDALQAQADSAEIKVLLDHEKLIFAMRREANDAQVAALRRLRSELDREVASLARQLASHDTLMQIVGKESDSVEALATRGLTTQGRKFELRRNVAQLEGDRLRLETGLIKVRQEITRTDMALTELHTRRMKEITNELQLTQHQLEQISLKWETAQNLMYESKVIAPIELHNRSSARTSMPIYTVIRKGSDMQRQDLPATESTVLEPGDIVKVELPLADDRSMPLDVRGRALTPGERPLQHQTVIPNDPALNLFKYD